MHQSMESKRRATASILQFLNCLLNHFRSAVFGRTVLEPVRSRDNVSGTKRWSSARLAAAPEKLKVFSRSHCIRRRQMNGCDSMLQVGREDLEEKVRGGVCMDGAYLAFADFSNAFLSNGRFRGSNLVGADLSRSIIIAGSFIDANLQNANLFSADLRHCNFRCADLSGANLRGANLASADLSGANLQGADLAGANLEGAVISGSIWNSPLQ